jgi:hypothetical protein
MTLADDLALLDAAEELTGYVPDPWRDYLVWVVLQPEDNPCRVELVRLLKDVVR